MTADIRRLIAPRSIALVGASAWTDAVAAGNAAVGYDGAIWRVHPTRTSTAAAPCYRSVADLPAAPDAAFIAVPNHEAPSVAGALAARGAGGFVCFTAGFSETGSEAGRRLTDDLVKQAGTVPFFGPNCYGFVNFFDRAAMLPDQVVGGRPDRGVALICQSGTIALTLMFNDRSLPIGCLFTVGNQTRIAVEDVIELLADDPRVSAFGLYLEGIKDTAAFARAADKARSLGKPIAVVKSGRTAAAALTAHSHTGALAGADSVFDAFCRQAGIARCDTLGTLCETLKLFHVGGALPGRKVLVMGASGGDMAMTSDVSRSLDLDFAPVPADRAATLRRLLTDRVTIANPFDIHTYLWFDPPTLGQVFSTALRSGYDAVGFMLDCPPEEKADTASFDAVIDVFIAAAQDARAPDAEAQNASAQNAEAQNAGAQNRRAQNAGAQNGRAQNAGARKTGAQVAAEPAAPSRAALIASLPETISSRIRQRCLEGGVIPMQGQREALEALSLAGGVGESCRLNQFPKLQIPSGIPNAPGTRSLTETEGKRVLAAHGVKVPRGRVASAAAVAETAAEIGFPVVLKAVGAQLEHKTEVGGVVLNVRSAAEATAAGERLAALSDTLLVEEMVTDGVAEILVGVIVDPQFGQVLVLGAGGVLTELLADTVTLLPPWTRDSIIAGLDRLRAAPLLKGYRGKPAGDIAALVDSILGVAGYASANLAEVVEIDVNPVIVRPAGLGVVAVDALIRLNVTELSQ
ncbi:MAG TPA: acetate--CoA ligase family protein [Steroidobacteraceae bacterium]|nr:acetate--CoA ligase family protein [Steroidobacteraceae bacterium]